MARHKFTFMPPGGPLPANPSTMEREDTDKIRNEFCQLVDASTMDVGDIVCLFADGSHKVEIQAKDVI